MYKPETAFGYLAEESLKKSYGKTGVRNIPVFPFTASYISALDGVILNIENENDLEAYHVADLTSRKVKDLDANISVKQVDPLMDVKSTISMFKNLHL